MQPFFCDVLADAVACRVFESVHEVRARYEKFCGERVDVDGLGDVCGEVLDDGLNFFVAGDGSGVELAADDGAIEEYHEFDEEHFRVELIREAMLARDALEFLDVKEKVVRVAFGEVHDA